MKMSTAESSLLFPLTGSWPGIWKAPPLSPARWAAPSLNFPKVSPGGISMDIQLP